MKRNTTSTKRHSIAAFVVASLFIMWGCDEPSKPNNGGGDTLVAPTITTQPASQTITEGGTLSLSVVATSTATLSYQWQRAASAATPFTDIAGATDASYTQQALTAADNGARYQVVVTATNSLKATKSTTSTIATLTVLNPATTLLWTHIDGTQKYAIATDTILFSRALTTTKTDIKSVDVIPSVITCIGDTAFSECTALTSITIPSTVTYIGEQAFALTALTTITIPGSVTSIASGIFASCTALASVTLLNGVKSIERFAFTQCRALTSVLLPNSLTRIGTQAFLDGSALTSITIPASVTDMGDGVFYRCSALTSVRVEATTPPTAQPDMFSGTHDLLVIRVPDDNVADYRSATHWSPYASRIYGYNQVVPDKIVWTDINGRRRYADAPTDSILLSTTLTKLKTDIKSVDTIPTGIHTIGQNAFTNAKLTSIIIPSHVTTIKLVAFNGITTLTRITIQQGVMRIEAEAFAKTGITNITIPASVTYLGSSVFLNCSALTSVRVEATTPPDAGFTIFQGTPATLSITVPSESVDAYKAAAGWRSYANQISGY